MRKKKLNNLVLGIDPGVNNLGWCITSFKGNIIKWGLVTRTLDDLKKPSDIHSFKGNMKELITILNSISSNGYPDFIMERYMPRGMRRGNQTERINIVIGYLLGKIRYNDVYMVPASTWKNRREREYTYIDNTSIPDHMIDTYTMTLYYLERIKGLLSTTDVKKKLKVIRETNYGWKKKKGVWVKE